MCLAKSQFADSLLYQYYSKTFCFSGSSDAEKGADPYETLDEEEGSKNEPSEGEAEDNSNENNNPSDQIDDEEEPSEDQNKEEDNDKNDDASSD